MNMQIEIIISLNYYNKITLLVLSCCQRYRVGSNKFDLYCKITKRIELGLVTDFYFPRLGDSKSHDDVMSNKRYFITVESNKQK